jgi:transposase
VSASFVTIRHWKAEQFHFDRNDEAIAAAEAFDGKLYIVTSLDAKAHPSADVVARYKALADIERGFRVLKSELLIAPVHHRLEKRIRAHALICFLALLLHRVLRQRLKQHGSPLSPNAALRLLAQIQQHQVSLAGNHYAGLTRQSPDQRDLFSHLAIGAPG